MMATQRERARSSASHLLFALAVAAFFLGSAAAARAQGVLVTADADHAFRLPRPMPGPQPVPVPSQSYKIKELDVQATLRDGVARVQVSQTFVNTGSQPMEVSFIFPLPYDGAVDQLTLLIDGKEHPARLLPADEARRVYEEIVRKNRDPALLEWLGSGMFKTSVFPVPAGAERKLTLRYSQICRRNHGLTDFLFPLSTAKYTSHPIEKLKLQIAIESQIEIKNVYSPTHAIEVKRADPQHATVTYASENQVPTSDFRLFCDNEAGKVGTALLSYRPSADDDGFFLLLATPEIKPAGETRPAKTVVFVVDRSGSMSGQKIEQAKGALKFVLENLRQGDLFNIIAYDSEIQSFRPELQKFSDDTRRAALGFVEGLAAGGSTNIDGALKTALAQLSDTQRPTYVIFLTDGLPTDGEQSEVKIAGNVQAANRVRARLFAFGVGYDVNSRLLDKLARISFGQSEYVRPSENIEAHVSRLYARIESPVMTDVAIDFAFDGLKPEEGAPVSRIYPQGVYDLFEGEQLVVVGRYKKSGPVKITVRGQIGGQPSQFDFAAELSATSADSTDGFVEKLWAVRRVGEIIDEIDLKGKNEELIKELVALSTKHGILTPYTSFLADEGTDLRAETANAARADGNLRMLSETAGRAGFSQRAAKGGYQNAQQAPALGVAQVADTQSDQSATVANLCNLGQKAFYRRGSRWVDSTVTEAQEQAAIHVAQFSDEYFQLAEKHGRTMSQYLVFDEPLLLNISGQCYLIEPPAK